MGMFPPYFVRPRNLAGDLEFRTNGDIVTERRALRTRQSSTGRNAEGVAYTDAYRPLHLVDQVAPALVPDDRHVLRWVVYRSDSVQDVAFLRWLDALQSDVSSPLWLIEFGQPVVSTWTMDGAASELYLYHVQAADAWEAHHGAPPEASAGFGSKETLDYEPWILVDGEPLAAFSRVDQATWDGGNPPPGEAWWLDQGQRIRLGDVPAFKAKVQVGYLPLWRVRIDSGQDGPSSSRGRTPGMEPRTLALTESQS